MSLGIQMGKEHAGGGWCMDNHHHPLLTANLAVAALLGNCIITVLMLLPTEVIWPLLAVKVYGLLLFDISIKIYFQAYCWSGDYQVHVFFLI